MKAAAFFSDTTQALRCRQLGRCLLVTVLLSVLSLEWIARGEDAKPAKVKLSDDVEKAFTVFLITAKEARTNSCKSDLIKLCREVATTVKLTEEQRKKLETDAAPAVPEACEKFAEKLDAWLRPFVAGYGDRALTNLKRWKPEQFAARPNVISSPQDTKAWDEAVKRVLNPDQLKAYQAELGDRTLRRKKEIADYLREPLAERRKQLAEIFKGERSSAIRDLALDPDRAGKLQGGEKEAIDVLLAEDEKTATQQFMEMPDESWQQFYTSGGIYQFEQRSGKAVPAREKMTRYFASVLSAEELKRWEELGKVRQTRRDRAAMMGTVAELEDKILLSSEQRGKFEKLFLSRWSQYSNNDMTQFYPMNLLRNGSDTDIRDLLTPEQKARWEDFQRGYGNNRAPKEAAGGKPKPPASPQAVDVDRVFAAHLVELYHSQRDRMVSEMQQRVDEIARVTSVSGEALKMIQTAAKGAVERVLDMEWRTNVERNLRASVEGVAPQFLQQRLEAMGESRFQTQPAEAQPLWLETLLSVLTEEQRQKYEAVQSEREAYRSQAVVAIILSQLDAEMRFSPEQAEKLESLLNGIVKEYWPDYQRSFGNMNYAIYPYYLPVLLAGVPEEKRKAILTPEQTKQFDADAQTKYSSWWDNIQRLHDERVKGKTR